MTKIEWTKIPGTSWGVRNPAFDVSVVPIGRGNYRAVVGDKTLIGNFGSRYEAIKGAENHIMKTINKISGKPADSKPNNPAKVNPANGSKPATTATEIPVAGAPAFRQDMQRAICLVGIAALVNNIDKIPAALDNLTLHELTDLSKVLLTLTSIFDEEAAGVLEKLQNSAKK